MRKGRPPLPIDPEAVRELARIGCNKSEIARTFGCDEATIRKRFAEIWEQGDQLGKNQLRRSQYKRATVNESDTMLIHLGMDRLGQKAKADVTSDGKAIQPLFHEFNDGRDEGLPPPAEAAPVRDDGG